ncbi:uncharacterized protein LOC111692378 [Anoplophora glabripennis]|uniref:uncharacterized protein LOC111692378 n=1 Tax=Anoplophora glabripennis TaxID=217634 RepID=UPI000C78D447|nr:uncharacterized protein LOC111692378 [Anoplophora glabripennis]
MKLIKGRILKFYCKSCLEDEPKKEIIEEIKKLNTVVKKQTSRIETLTEELLMLTKKFDKLEEKSTKQSNVIESAVIEIKSNVNTKPLYSQTVTGNKVNGKNTSNSKDPVLIVKPKEVQSSDKTKKEIKEKIDPSRLGAGVAGLREAHRGQVVIRCGNEEAREKIQNKICEEMSGDYDIRKPNLKYPRIKIIGVNEEDDDTDDNLLNAIKDQNLTEHGSEEGFHLKIIKRIKKANREITLILEADSKTHNILLNKGKIFIGWSRGKAYDYVHVVRCFKCFGFNHMAKDCKNNNICYKCSLEHTGECKARYNKCINCSNAIEKYKIKIKDNHNALDPKCPCYIRILNSIKRKIDYLDDQ